GNGTPDWRLPKPTEIAADWKDMTLPGNWESKGLPDFDGIVWFTRNVDVPAGANPNFISLGPVRNTARLWINGVALNGPGFGFGGRGAAAPPAGVAGGAPATVPAAPAATSPAPAAGAQGGGRRGGGAGGAAAAPPTPTGPVAANITA